MLVLLCVTPTASMLLLPASESVMVPASELVMVPKLPESTALLMMVVLVVVKVHANSVLVMVLAVVMAIAQRLQNDNASRRAHNRHLHPMVSRGGLQR
jgi:hypothetical protein